MMSPKLATLRFVALLCLLPGLAGLVISAVVSTYYMDTLPRWPAPEQMRTIPRNINGFVVYQTVEENRRLSLLEGSSVTVFVVGLALGLVYLEKWGGSRGSEPDDDPELSEHYS